jgi:hypothetical protein
MILKVNLCEPLKRKLLAGAGGTVARENPPMCEFYHQYRMAPGFGCFPVQHFNGPWITVDPRTPASWL